MVEIMNEGARDRAVARCRERRVLIPTFSQMRNPADLNPVVRQRLPSVDMQELDPINLFRITWRNDLRTGGFGEVNHVEFPPELTGVPARIVGLVGKHFPTGSHKVGAAFGCLVPRLVAGEFDPTKQKAVWPSTGNYCRGGAFDSALLGCPAMAILPEEMSQERFDWLAGIGAEIIATPGCESNVKEIFDMCWDIRRTRDDVVIFNQFEEIGNYLWHFGVTGPAVEATFQQIATGNDRLAAWVCATGSGGTLAAGDFLRKRFAGFPIVAAEALQCPTLLLSGFGAHRIEGIGDKHIPWIHNVRNTDVIAAIDDEATIRLLRLFNSPSGQETLVARGIPPDTVAALPLLGISSICNLLAAIKTARYFEMEESDILFTCLTDSVDLYQTRLRGPGAIEGAPTEIQAHSDFDRFLMGVSTDHLKELRYPDQKALHNLKYFTWVEQQGRTVGELDALWSPGYWDDLAALLPEWDAAIEAFNADTGVLEMLRSES